MKLYDLYNFAIQKLNQMLFHEFADFLKLKKKI